MGVAGSSGSHHVDDDSDYDGDSEEDELRKKTEPSPMRAAYNVSHTTYTFNSTSYLAPWRALRGYLRTKGVMARKYREDPPAGVSAERLAVFNAAGHPGPDSSAPQMDWESDNTSRWNKTMILALVVDFHASIENGEQEPVPRGFASVKRIRKDLVRRLEGERKNYRLHASPTFNEEREEELAASRRRGRRINVRYHNLIMRFVCLHRELDIQPSH